MVFDANPLHGRAEGGATAGVLRIRLPFMGVPVEFETDAPLVRAAVEGALGSWRLLEQRPELVSSSARTLPRIQLRLAHDPCDPAGDITVSSAAPGLVELNGPGVHGSADGARLTAACTVTAAVLEDRYVFEETVLPSLVLNLTTHLDRQPLHAAAVRRGAHTVLLHGPSGAGKSTLAYAASGTGWHVLSDDAVFLQAKPQLRIWARPSRLHLPPEAVAWFPELAERPLVRRQNGRWKVWVEPTAAWPAVLQPAEHAILCLLERGDGEPDARKIAGAAAVRTVLDSLEPGFVLFRDTIGPVLRTLVGRHAWIVRTGPDPWRTVQLLDQLRDA